ncbi:MAG: hypothetical protein GY821_00125, partial [Gammaproteobacteria bacterium]|nr:hypothetical protein [Gammaproteobacteria bacterium]
MQQRIDGEGSWNWTYATTGDATHPVGKLKSVSGPNAYLKQYGYNADLLPESTTETQTLPDNTSSVLTQTVSYDELGRVDRQYFPNGFETSNEYNRYGHLVAVKSPAMAISAEARTKLEAKKAAAVQKAVDAETQATSYMTQAIGYQSTAVYYETYAMSLLRLEAINSSNNSTTDALYEAANKLRDISMALIDQAETAQNDALAQTVLAQNLEDQIQNGTVGDSYNTHRLAAIEKAQEARYALDKARSVIDEIQADGNYNNYPATASMLNSAESYLNYAHESTTSFQNQQALAERYYRLAQGINTDLADTSATTWWRASAADAEGRITEAVFGNGLSTTRNYDPNTGQLMRIHTSDGVQSLQDLNYGYDHLNNVKSRRDEVLNYGETYQYDSLERLKLATLSIDNLGSASRDWAYDKVGNFESIDSTTFSYDEADKLSAIVDEGKSYDYDANGNQTESAGRTIAWTSFNKPTLLTKGTKQSEFTYNANHSRMLKANKTSMMLDKTTIYFGGYEKIIEASTGNIEHRYNVAVGSSVVAVHSVKTDSVSSNYLHKDALGSVDLITDDKGEVVERLGYTPFGTRRDLTTVIEMVEYGAVQISNFTPLVTKR